MLERGDLLSFAVEWIWLPLTGVVIWIWGKIVSVDKDATAKFADADKRLSLLEHHWSDIETKIEETEKRRREDRQEIMESLARHHQVIYSKLDALSVQLIAKQDK